MNPITGPLYHLALADEWRAVVEAGEDYCRSTVGRSLEDEGFIHTSFADQVEGTARAYYQNLDVVLLEIEPEAVPSPIRLDELPDGREFPHIYGPIPTAAVRAAVPVPKGSDGNLDLSGLLP